MRLSLFRKERLQTLPTAEDIAERFATAENGKAKTRNPSDSSLPPPPPQPLEQKEAKCEKTREISPQSPDSLLSEQAADKGEVLRRFDLRPQGKLASSTLTL
jgi:hypothetical protein